MDRRGQHDGLSMLWILAKIFGLGAVCLVVAWLLTAVLMPLL
jgi:hypothetical protein